MADQQSVSQLLVQAEYQEPPQQNISQFLVQAEYQGPPQQNISQFIVQVEYQDPPEPVTGSVMRLSQLTGIHTPKSIINYCSSGGVQVPLTAASNLRVKQINSGTLTANTLGTVLSVTGAGEISALLAMALDTTSRTVRLKVTMDGTVVFDATSSAITVANTGLVAIGTALVNGSTSLFDTNKKTFNSSLLVEVASSLTETDKIAIGVIYDLY